MLLKKITIKNWVIALCVFNFVVRIPFSNVNLNFDEFAYVDGVYAVMANHLNPFVEFWGYKPPMMFWLPALLSCFVGENQIIPRLTIYFYSSCLLFGVYLIGRDVFKKEMAGLWAVILLFFYPMFMTQSFLFQDQIPTALFLTMSFYFLFTDNKKWYFFSSILLLMTRELGIVSIGVFFLNDWWFRKKRLVESAKWHFPSMFVFGCWLISNKYFLGWYMWPYNIGLVNIAKIFNYNFFVGLEELLLSSGLLLILLFPFIKINKKFKIYFYPLLWIYLINGLFCSVVGFLPRYFFYPIPVLLVLFAVSVTNTFKDNLVIKRFFYMILILVSLNHFYNVFISNYYLSGDNDLRLFKNIKWANGLSLKAKTICDDCVYISNIPTVGERIRRYYGGSDIYCEINNSLDNCIDLAKKSGHIAFLYIIDEGGLSSIDNLKNKYQIEYVGEYFLKNFLGNEEQKVFYYISK